MALAQEKALLPAIAGSDSRLEKTQTIVRIVFGNHAQIFTGPVMTKALSNSKIHRLAAFIPAT